MVYLQYFFFIYQDSPAIPWTLQEWQFACSEGILRLSQDNCACTRRWRTWQRREEGWPRWQRRQCSSRPGHRGPGFGEARSTVQKSRSGQGLGTAWSKVPAKITARFCLVSLLTTHNLTAKCWRRTSDFALANNTAPGSSIWSNRWSKGEK